MTLPLYRRVLGSRFDALPARVRELHDLHGPSVWAGMASVERGRSLAAASPRWSPACRRRVPISRCG